MLLLEPAASNSYCPCNELLHSILVIEAVGRLRSFLRLHVLKRPILNHRHYPPSSVSEIKRPGGVNPLLLCGIVGTGTSLSLPCQD